MKHSVLSLFYTPTATTSAVSTAAGQIKRLFSRRNTGKTERRATVLKVAVVMVMTTTVMIIMMVMIMQVMTLYFFLLFWTSDYNYLHILPPPSFSPSQPIRHAAAPTRPEPVLSVNRNSLTINHARKARGHATHKRSTPGSLMPYHTQRTRHPGWQRMVKRAVCQQVQ